MASALDNLQRERYQAAVVNAIHGAINACDALTVSQLAQRASGAHEELLVLVEKSGVSAELRHSLLKQLRLVLAIKNQVEYQPELVDAEQARQAVRAAERVLAKTRTVVLLP